MNGNYWKQMMDVQKNFYDQWQKTLFAETESMMPSFASMFKPYIEFNKNLFSGMNGSEAFDVYSKMLGSNDTYLNVFKLWQDLAAKTVDPIKESSQEIFDEWEDKVENNFESIILPHIPENLKTYIQSPKELSKIYREVMTSLYEPWFDVTIDYDKYIVKGLGDNSVGYIDFVKLWKDNYSDTFGKIVNSPAMGANREYIEKQGELVDTFVQYLTNIGEFSSIIYATSYETVKKVITDYTEMAGESTQPKTFKEFYDYWSKEMDKAYEKLFTTNEFSKLMGQYVDATMDFKIKYDSIMEDFIKTLPIPTRTEMNSAYKTIDSLKRDIRELKKQIKELSNDKTKKTVSKKEQTKE